MSNNKTIWLRVDESWTYDETQILVDTVEDTLDCSVVVVPESIEMFTVNEVRELLKDLVEMYEVEL